jgi:hypothetical protein
VDTHTQVKAGFAAALSLQNSTEQQQKKHAGQMAMKK